MALKLERDMYMFKPVEIRQRFVNGIVYVDRWRINKEDIYYNIPYRGKTIDVYIQQAIFGFIGEQKIKEFSKPLAGEFADAAALWQVLDRKGRDFKDYVTLRLIKDAEMAMAILNYVIQEDATEKE